MKTLFAILFFGDVLVLIALSVVFLQWLDAGITWFELGALLFGMFACIILLCFFLFCYVDSPRSDKGHPLAD